MTDLGEFPDREMRPHPTAVRSARAFAAALVAALRAETGAQ
jgi:hypothetical protein